MENWKFHDINFEGQTKKVEGLDIWKHEWHPSESKSFKAPHPQHPSQWHLMCVYTIEANDRQVSFAASEVSNMVWSIYVPK
ncbi:hypothetical protein [Aliiglaciecola litoralis]|uniref:Uncharacterized protein n=1 Tax=Aliiglaciecola litoralis TaxID=582857 RepID=A0ABN1LU28_9ALTE